MEKTSSLAYLGLGSNLNHPQTQLQKAIKALQIANEIDLLDVSSFYLSKPMGPSDQDDYINLVVKVKTDLKPLELLAFCQDLENKHQRNRDVERWGPRTLDLDILLYDQDLFKSPELTIPHIGLKERNFVILPLAEIASELILPDGDKITELAENCDRSGIIRL